MGESHHLYAQVRSPRRPESERVMLYLQLKRLWDDLPVRSHVPREAGVAPRKHHHTIDARLLVAGARGCGKHRP